MPPSTRIRSINMLAGSIGSPRDQAFRRYSWSSTLHNSQNCIAATSSRGTRYAYGATGEVRLRISLGTSFGMTDPVMFLTPRELYAERHRKQHGPCARTSPGGGNVERFPQVGTPNWQEEGVPTHGPGGLTKQFERQPSKFPGGKQGAPTAASAVTAGVAAAGWAARGRVCSEPGVNGNPDRVKTA